LCGCSFQNKLPPLRRPSPLLLFFSFVGI
jgi:hypothetical protein